MLEEQVVHLPELFLRASRLSRFRGLSSVRV
jgi:hypothetical protein